MSYETQVAVEGFQNPEFPKFLEFGRFLEAKHVTPQTLNKRTQKKTSHDTA